MIQQYPLRLAMIIAMVCAMLLQTACSSHSLSADEKATVTPIPRSVEPNTTTYQVQRGDITVQVQFTGRVVPITKQALYFSSTGRVRKVYIKGDEMVKAGQVLATLDNLTDLQRQQALEQLDLERAQEELEIAGLRLEQIKEQTHLVSSNKPNYDVLIQEHQVRLAQIAVDEVKLHAQDLDQALANAQIIAPFDGKILSLTNAEGTTVEAYNTVMVLGDVSKLEVNADLDNNTMQGLAEGMPVTAVPEKYPDQTFQGYIQQLAYPFGSGISGNGEEIPSIRVTLQTDLVKDGFALGDRLLVTVLLQHKADVLWLPPEAISTFGGRNFVIVQDGDVQRRVDVQLGVWGVNRVEILEGLTEGQVVTSP